MDLYYRNNIIFTYERDDGLVRSWPDHVLTLAHHSSVISNVKSIHSGTNLSDHSPLAFDIKFDSNLDHTSPVTSISAGSSFLSGRPPEIDWEKITAADVECFHQMLADGLPSVSPDVLDCVAIECSSHRADIDLYCSQLLALISSCATSCLPSKINRFKAVPGWNDHVRQYKESSVFWNKLWVEAGCPKSGILFDLRKKTRSSYKYSVRRVKRQRRHIVRKKIGTALTSKDNITFWKEVKKVKSRTRNHVSLSSSVDGFSDDHEISSNFRDKLSHILNSTDIQETDRNALMSDITCNISASDVKEVVIEPHVVAECLKKLGKDKSDGSSVSSNLLILASPMLYSFLSELFTVILRHGYMPESLRDCTLVPIPKPFKDPTLSDSYRPIALAPNLSKVLERCILSQFGYCFFTSDLQFGFKPGFSTDLCTGVLKNVVSKYLHRKSHVFSCFLDASKAFDRVNHEKLFRLLIRRQVPPAILRFLFSWYQSQLFMVRWNKTLSSSFGASNGVRQGGVLSPILFTVYIDELLTRLSRLGIGCYSGHLFAGSLGYADDIALLAPSPSALRILLSECEKFAEEYDLIFNAAKTQLICFRSDKKISLPDGVFCFLGHPFSFSNSIVHLGHTLLFNLDDADDISRVASDLCRKSNYLLSTFSSCDPLVKTKLVDSHCLSLYGSVLWNMGNKQIKSLEVIFNNILRRIWKLPRHCHTGILHQIAGVSSIYNRISKSFSSFLSKAISLDCPLISKCFNSTSMLVCTACGYNNFYKSKYIKHYSEDELVCADFVRDIRLGRIVFDSVDTTSCIITSVCCD